MDLQDKLVGRDSRGFKNPPKPTNDVAVQSGYESDFDLEYTVGNPVYVSEQEIEMKGNHDGTYTHEVLLEGNNQHLKPQRVSGLTPLKDNGRGEERQGPLESTGKKELRKVARNSERNSGSKQSGEVNCIRRTLPTPPQTNQQRAKPILKNSPDSRFYELDSAQIEEGKVIQKHKSNRRTLQIESESEGDGEEDRSLESDSDSSDNRKLHRSSQGKSSFRKKNIEGKKGVSEGRKNKIREDESDSEVSSSEEVSSYRRYHDKSRSGRGRREENGKGTKGRKKMNRDNESFSDDDSSRSPMKYSDSMGRSKNNSYASRSRHSKSRNDCPEDRERNYYREDKKEAKLVFEGSFGVDSSLSLSKELSD